MKGRSCAAIFFVVLALLFTSAPGYSKTTAPKRSKRTSQKEPQLDSGQKYSVRRGDSLIKIARDFGTTPGAIKSANRMKSNRIKAGQTLNIPVAQSAATKTEAQRVSEISDTAKQKYMSAVPAEVAGTGEVTDPENVPTRLRLVQAGFELIGVRYRFGGLGTSGFDCSGLVKTLFSKFDINLPRSSREQFKQGEKISKEDLQVGDLVFFSSGGTQPTHVGIYVGNNQFLHAARKARQVVVSDLSKIWYKVRYLGARRVTDLWGDEPVSE